MFIKCINAAFNSKAYMDKVLRQVIYKGVMGIRRQIGIMACNLGICSARGMKHYSFVCLLRTLVFKRQVY